MVLKEISTDKGTFVHVEPDGDKDCCDECCFLKECAGDGDGTEIEGIGCTPGYVWKVLRKIKVVLKLC